MSAYRKLRTERLCLIGTEVSTKFYFDACVCGTPTNLPGFATTELYLELHRGTATSHGSIKRGNRKSEILLREIEYTATLASISSQSKSYMYPKDQLDQLWKGVLLNQFHDVLPGSAIGMVYEDAEKVDSTVSEQREHSC